MVVFESFATLGSVRHCLDFVPRGKGEDVAAARRAGLNAAELAPKYLARRDTGSSAIRSSTRNLASAIERLPMVVKAHLRGSVDAPLSELAASPPSPTAISIESFRAKILKSGGQSPRVQLKVRGMDRPVTLEAEQELAQVAGRTLYAEADVTARIERASDERVLSGQLLELRILDDGDPVAAFDRWYEKSGHPWAKVTDIEKGLGRGEN
jgi:hypothetical protein